MTHQTLVLPIQQLSVCEQRNEVTGSTHDVTITEEFDKEFQELAATHSQPDILSTNLAENPESFDLDKVQQHFDTGSTDDLTAEEEPED